MKLNITLAAMLAATCIEGVAAADFNENFCDSTLRVDYILGGGPSGIRIMLDSQSKQKGWAGRRTRLKDVPVAGNGTVMVTDPQTGDTLYRNTFSSLFQEWIYTPEAKEKEMAFENSFLVPLPRREADITVSLRSNRHDEIGRFTHRYRPDDELVALRGVNPNPHTYIHKGGDSSEAIDIAILAEGYRQEEMDTFLKRATRIAEEILSYEPFVSNKDKFNVVAVMTPSKESGVSIPLNGDWRDTAFESHFSTFYSSRYLTTPRVWKLHRSLEGIPYEHVLVLVNTPVYGGGGIFNSYQIATADHELTLPVAVHEFGHSFAGLADEYFYTEEEDGTYPLDIEPWEQNITTMVDFDSKWKDMLTAGVKVPTPWTDKGGTREERMRRAGEEKRGEVVVGAFEGGGYKAKGVYRPVETCRMRDNHNPAFCPVCERSIRRVIDFYTAK
ncbi:MAG: IgA Peptidase M64 [Muribaculaceae bacterium]|nr:IgA Peptidase M64 [Muribaculaceae bacterium]